MKRRLFSLLLTLGLLCALPSAAAAEETSPAVTALYVTAPGESVFLDEAEFQLLCRQATGRDLESVVFGVPSAAVGTLTFKGKSLKAGEACWPTRSPQLSQVCFTPYSHPYHSFTGSAQIPFTITAENDDTVSGTLLLCVPEPSDELPEVSSQMAVTAFVNTDEPIALVDYLPDKVWQRVSGTPGSGSWYHDATGTYAQRDLVSAVFTLPTSDRGCLWLDYGAANARKVLPDEVLYPGQDPNFYDVTFVPAEDSPSTVRLDYTASCGEGKDVNGSLTLKPPVPQPPAPEPAGPIFRDLDGWEWAAPAAQFLGEKGYRRGESYFCPGEQVTRMDLIHALVLTAYSGLGWDAPVPDFTDLPQDPDLARDAAVAAKYGLVLGNGQGQLLPDENVTRQDALVMLHRAFAHRRGLPSLPSDLSAFSDSGDVAPYAREAVEDFTVRGVVQGDGAGQLDPLSPITRAEMASLLYRLFS